jgi:LacI family transcriptional regulator
MAGKGQVNTPRVAVLVDTSTMWGRQVVAGIQHYALRHGPWLTFIEPRGIEEVLRVPQGWRGHGVIARIGQPEMARELKALRRPVVNVSGILAPGATFPRVTTDLAASGRMAADYFHQRGYRHFGYFALTGLSYVAAQQEAFAAQVAETGGSFAVYAVRPHRGAEPDWNLSLEQLGAWLRGLPKPVAILTWNASASRELLYAAQAVGLTVPEDVAVLSGTDDDLFCEFSPVPLSGIRPPAEQIGHRAAAMLDRLMAGKAAPARPVVLPPTGITTRRSTDTLAIGDPALVKAMRYIREHATTEIGVAEVARHAGVSRRALELKFRQSLQRSPAIELRRVRLAAAADLLERTDLPIPEVAARAGFGSPEYLSFAFVKTHGQTPLKYRRAVRCR